MSKYENIKSVVDLMVEIKVHGLSTNLEDICKAQDIVGNAPYKQLIEIANNRNEYGDTFLNTIFKIWNWEDAVDFYNRHANPVWKKMMEESEMLEQTEEKLANAIQEKDTAIKNALFMCDDNAKAYTKIEEMTKKMEEYELEIMKLKAKLYDTMCGG